jgi:hypothetical protein
MPKKILEDIKINKHVNSKLNRNVDDFKLDKNRKEEDFEKIFVRKDFQDNTVFQEKRKKFFNKKDRYISSSPKIKTKTKVRKVFLFFFCISVVCASFYFIADKFTNAKISVTNREEAIKLENKSFTAKKDINSEIPFEIMIVDNEDTKSLYLTKSEEISKKASGKIVLYNEYSNLPQKITANSYLADNNGKTYLLDNTIIIPGYKLQNGKIIPGSVEASITAFLPGSVYNGNPTDFYISAFKNTSKYKKIYAKTKTELAGGMQGLVYVVGDEDIKILDNFANGIFKDNLIKKANAMIPEGYMLYKNSLNFYYEIDKSLFSENPKVEIKLKGYLNALIMKRDALSSSIIKSIYPKITKSEFQEISLTNLDSLSFVFNKDSESISKDTNQVNFKIEGEALLVWNPNIALLKSQIVGIHKDSILEIFKKDPGILNAEITIFPFWNNFVPQDPSRININIQ